MKLIFLVFLIFIGGCNYSRSKQPPQNSGFQKADIGPVDFNTVKTTVIGPKCLRCHSVAGGNQGNTNLESFAAVKNLIARINYRSLVKKDMPPSSLSNSEANILNAWIEQGAPEENLGPVNKIDPEIEKAPVSFALVKEKIFQNRCLACHSGEKPDAGLDLTDLTVTRNSADKIFKSIFVSQTMPVPPLPGLSPAERRVLLKWFDLGMPQ